MDPDPALDNSTAAESAVRDANVAARRGGPGDEAPDALTRRGVLRGGGKLLVYSAPFVQLFRPSAAYAGSTMSAT